MEDILKNPINWLLLNKIRSYDETLFHHSIDAARLSDLVASELMLSEQDREFIRISAVMHDIGKTTWPEYMKRERNLTEEDREYILSHPIKGALIIKKYWPNVPDIITRIVEEHHERPNGCGYPTGRRGEQISPLSRLVAACEAFAAMISIRSYRDTPLSCAAALTILRNNGFDPVLLNAISKINKKIRDR